MLDGLTGADAWPWVVLVACAGVTYSARWLGVMLSGRVNAGDEIFKWVNCVAWAMLGALVARLILLPSGPLATVPLSTEPLFAYTHPQGTQPLARLPVVVTYSGAEVRLTTEWDGTTWAFPLTWTDLARAPLCAGWEVRQEVRISPHLESSTPYLVFRIPTYGLVVAIHPNAVRVLASSLSRLVKA